MMDTDVTGAKKIFQEQFQMCPPWHKPVCLYNLACCDSLLGDTDSALSFLARSIDAGYRDVAHMQADADLNNIRHTEAYKLLIAGILERGAPPSDVNPQKLYNVACFCALVGNLESSIASLEKAIETGFSRQNQMQCNPDLAALHSHPKWPALIEACGKNKAQRMGQCRDRKPWRARKCCQKSAEIPPQPKPEIPVPEVKPEVPAPEAVVVQEASEVVEEPKPVAAVGVPEDGEMAAALQVLNEMGFLDKDRNMVALLTTRGDIEKAIMHLLQ